VVHGLLNDARIDLPSQFKKRKLSSPLRLLAELAGREAFHIAEDAGEVTLIAEAAAVGDGGERIFRMQQHFAGMVHAALVQ